MADEQYWIINQNTGTLLQRIHPDEISGLWAKTLEVPPGQRALAVRGDRIDDLKPGKHQFGGLGRRRPDDITLIRDGPVTLHPAAGGLLSYDDQLLEADFLMQIRVTDPARFYAAVARGREELTPGELAAMVAEAVRGKLDSFVRRHTADALGHDEAIADRAAGELRGFVAAYLEPMGIEVEGLRYLSFRRAEDAVKRAEALRQLRSRLRESQVKDRLAAIQSRADFLDTVKQIAHEYGLRDQLRQEEWEMLVAEVWGEAGEPVQPSGRQVAESLEAKLASFEDQLVARFEALLRKVDYEGPKDERINAIEETIKNLGRWIDILRALGMFIIFGTTLLTIFMPEFFADDRLPRIVTSVAGLILAILAFASALWLHSKVKEYRRTILAEKTQRQVKPAQRQAAERLVRARVTGALQQVESNLDQAWNRAYRGPDKDAAVAMRRLRDMTRDLQEEVKAANYWASAYLTRDKVPAEQLQAVLEIDEGLLARTDALTQTSRDLHRQVVEYGSRDLEAGMKLLEVGLQELRGQFIERTALVRG